jgi:aminoglycoside phosphotransferase (APT) family kinase protein
MSDSLATSMDERGSLQEMTNMDREQRQAASQPPFDPIARERLRAHLRAHGHELGPEEFSRFAGGLANLNYLVMVDGSRTVLRMPPPGELPPGAHDMVREHRVMSALSQALPLVPRSIYLCQDRSVLGVPFQLIEFRPGVVIHGTDLGEFEDRPRIGAELSQMMIETLTRIHAVDPRSVGLENFGKPEGFTGRAIEGWVKRANRLTETSAVSSLVDELATWMHSRKTLEQKPTLLHCDFKLDNCILDPISLQPVAVIDWDMGTHGDPLFDLATMISYWAEPNDPPCMQKLGQMPTSRTGFASRREVIERYAALSGVRMDDFSLFRTLAVFKLGVVFLQLHRRWRAGGMIGDERYGSFGVLGVELLEFARSIARGEAE